MTEAPVTAPEPSDARPDAPLDAPVVERVEVEPVNAKQVRKLYASRVKVHPKRVAGRFRRLKWVVMLAPPNQGAMLASRFRTNPVFRALSAVSAREIADWEELEAQLVVA